MSKRLPADFKAAGHAGDFFHPRFIIQKFHAGLPGLTFQHGFHPPVSIGMRRHLRQMGDTQYLPRIRQLLQQATDD